jgi:hypothetical protein
MDRHKLVERCEMIVEQILNFLKRKPDTPVKVPTEPAATRKIDLGAALLSPGPKAVLPTPPPVAAKSALPPEPNAEKATVVLPASEVAPTPSTLESVMPLVDDMREDLPPRTPEEVARLIPLENYTQRIARIRNDHVRYLRQHNRPIW